VRVRLTRIDNQDLNLFDFDLDLTFMVFFLNAEGKVYARYGGRDGKSPDSRQSLEGLRYTMTSVLSMHTAKEKRFAPRRQAEPRYIREVAGLRRGRGCLHCHQVKEILNHNAERKGTALRDLVCRYPLPENVGIELDLDRGNEIRTVKERSPAQQAGLRSGDVLRQLDDIPIHSFADVQQALDRAPRSGAVAVRWERDHKPMQGKLTLKEGWKKGDIFWRPSMQGYVPSARMYGRNLTAEQKKALGLSERQLAFRQSTPIQAQARAAGVRVGDIILGIDDKKLEMDADAFLRYVEHNYLVGDRVTVQLLRDGKRMSLTMLLLR
jgi:serine protease Do